jgi:hypothetical protein
VYFAVAIVSGSLFGLFVSIGYSAVFDLFSISREVGALSSLFIHAIYCIIWIFPYEQIHYWGPLRKRMFTVRDTVLNTPELLQFAPFSYSFFIATPVGVRIGLFAH